MSTYEISKSSLLSLKAEILRKHQELASAKSENEKKIKLIKKNTPLEFKNTNKSNKEETFESAAEIEECQDLLRKSKLILEQKAALYDRLRTGNSTEEEKQQNKNVLVRFDEKNVTCSESDEEPDKYPESEDDYHYSEDDNCDPAEKWVEYVDCLGRTRKCLGKDLEYLKSKDEELKKVVNAKKKVADNTATYSDSTPVNNNEEEWEKDTNRNTENLESELLSSDMRREMLREQWEKEEDELRKKSDVHYQDVLFGEARTHGVGYYGFSKNEEERLKQLEALKRLREETEQKQRRAQDLKLMREKQLAARIKAAKDRRRARLGLPPEDEEEPEAPPSEAQVSEEEKMKQLELEKRKAETEEILNEARRRHLRPWDVGKDGVTKEHYEMTQEEWNEMKRSERVEDFAPPTSYSRNNFAENKDEKKIDTNTSDDDSKRKKRYKKNKQWREEKRSLSGHDHKLITNKYDVDDLIDLTNAGSIADSGCSYGNRELSHSKRRRGTEIPPPLQFDYFGPSSSKVPRKSFEKDDINESIEAGLQFLRKQLEEKEKRPKRVL